MRKEVGNEGPFEFTSSFLSIVYAILNGGDALRLFPEAQSFLKLRKDVRYGDWFSHKEHIEIILFRADIKPFRFLIFFHMRFFSLEFIRKGLNVDQVHFVPVKKGHMFKITRTVGPIIVNTRQALEVAYKILTDLHLSLEGKWAYDSYHVISNNRVENGYSAFFS